MTTKKPICDRQTDTGVWAEEGGKKNQRVKQQTDQLTKIKKNKMKNQIKKQRYRRKERTDKRVM